MKSEFTAIIEAAPEGGYWAICPEVPGANGQGETVNETKESLKEAIELISDDFSDDRYNERLRLMKIINTTDNRIEPVPYNPEQFIETDPLVWEIKKHGIEINLKY